MKINPAIATNQQPDANTNISDISDDIAIDFKNAVETKAADKHPNGLRFNCYFENEEIECIPKDGFLRRFVLCHPTDLERKRAGGLVKMMTGAALFASSTAGLVLTNTLHSNVTIRNPAYVDPNTDYRSPLNQFYLYAILIPGFWMFYSGFSATFCSGHKIEPDPDDE